MKCGKCGKEMPFWKAQPPQGLGVGFLCDSCANKCYMCGKELSSWEKFLFNFSDHRYSPSHTYCSSCVKIWFKWQWKSNLKVILFTITFILLLWFGVNIYFKLPVKMQALLTNGIFWGKLIFCGFGIVVCIYYLFQFVKESLLPKNQTKSTISSVPDIPIDKNITDEPKTKLKDEGQQKFF